MTVKELDFSDPRAVARWDALARESGELYHHCRWGGVLRQAFSFTPLYLYGEERGEMVSLLPLFLVRRPLGGVQAVSLPHLEAGGVLPAAAYRPFLDHLFRRLGECDLLLLQYREPLPDLPVQSEEAVLVKPLPATSGEIIASLPASNARNLMRQSLRTPYRVEAGNSEELWDVFYRLYLDKMREFGTPPQARGFFRAIGEGFGDRCAVIALGEPGGGWAAACLVVGADATLNSVAFVASAQKLKRLAGYALQYQVFRYALERGYGSLILGRSEKESGNYAYKKSLGGVPVPLFRYRLRLTASGCTPLAAQSVKSRYRGLAKTWSLLPAPLTDHLGPVLRKWLY